MESLRGQLLISSGGLYDPNFRHTVVLVGDHGGHGAVGVILNRVLNVTIEEAIPSLAGLVGPAANLFEGGPVQPDSPVLLADFVEGNAADLPVFESVGFLVGEVPADGRSNIRRARAFAGYSGWAPGQLESEMQAGSWILEPARVEDVFTDVPDLLWSRVLERKGPKYRQLSRMPFDPSMN